VSFFNIAATPSLASFLTSVSIAAAFTAGAVAVALLAAMAGLLAAALFVAVGGPQEIDKSDPALITATKIIVFRIHSPSKVRDASKVSKADQPPHPF
jgi:hypothetical protein